MISHHRRVVILSVVTALVVGTALASRKVTQLSPTSQMSADRLLEKNMFSAGDPRTLNLPNPQTTDGAKSPRRQFIVFRNELGEMAPTSQGKIGFLSSKPIGGFEWAVYTINLDGTQENRITENGIGVRTSFFVWSPRGTQIAFENEEPGFGRSVRVVNSDGSGLKTISNGITNAMNPAWSPDGSRVIFSSDDGLYVANVDGSALRRLTVDSSDNHPAWSPNGLQIAYARAVNNEFNIFSMKPDGTAQNNLTSGSSPVWSPSGSKLLFVRGTGADVSDIFTMNKDGTNQIDLTNSQTSNLDPKWSPDGNRILFTRTLSSTAKIFVMNSDGSAQTQLTNNTAQNAQAEWSPDGTKIIFISDRDVAGVFNAVYLMNADGSSEQRVINGNGYDVVQPQWQPIPTANENPINLSDFFVRQHYLDFLGREPDQSGQNFWTNNITSCGSDAQCVEVKRINTSAAFFLSIEFQQTGNLVYKMYKAGFGNLSGKPVAVDRAPFMADTGQIQSTPAQVIVGQPGWDTQLEANKQAFALAFVQRSAFQTQHAGQTADQYVASLFANTGASPTSAETTAAVNTFNGAGGGDAGRAAALRSVAESGSVHSKLVNEAFVLMQYFGYLQRNPYDPPELTLDYSGYNFWLNKLNSFGGDYIKAEMVKAFIASDEYRHRFGP